LDLTVVLGIVAGIFTSISLLPQVIKILKEKRVEDLSVTMFVILTIGLSLWIAYGIIKKDMPIVITNAFSVALNLFILILRHKYKRQK